MTFTNLQATVKKRKDFAKKHRPDAKPDSAVRDEILKQMENGALSCAAAFKIAEKLKVSAEKIGMTADLISCRLTGCQLGLFGYGSAEDKKIQDNIPKALKAAVNDALVKRKLPCKKAWEIASEYKVNKTAVTLLCNSLNIKISECQLRAF